MVPSGSRQETMEAKVELPIRSTETIGSWQTIASLGLVRGPPLPVVALFPMSAWEDGQGPQAIL